MMSESIHEEVIAKAIKEAREEEELDSGGSCRFPARQLGATACVDPAIWAIDCRDTGENNIDPASFDPPLRQIGDPGIDEAVNGLLQAGLRVPIKNLPR